MAPVPDSKTKRNKWRTGWLCLAAIGIIGLLVVLSQHRNEGPVYQGKPLKYWVERIDSDEAQAALSSADVEAVPYLMHLLLARESRLGTWIAKLSDAIPALAAIIPSRSSLRDNAAEALIIIGPKCIPALRDYYESEDPAVRDQAIVALILYRGESREVLDLFLRALSDDNDLVRFHAAFALGYFPDDSDVIVPALAELTADQDAHVRLMAIALLRRLGPEAISAIPQLIERMQDEDEHVRSLATNALQHIAPDRSTED